MEYKNHRLAWKGRYLDDKSEDYLKGYSDGLSEYMSGIDLIQTHLQKLDQIIEELARRSAEPEKKED